MVGVCPGRRIRIESPRPKEFSELASDLSSLQSYKSRERHVSIRTSPERGRLDPHKSRPDRHRGDDTIRTSPKRGRHDPRKYNTIHSDNSSMSLAAARMIRQFFPSVPLVSARNTDARG